MGRSQYTWREHYAPIISEHIRTILDQTPDITYKRLRWLLGRLNPGPYHWQRRVWGKEATRQVRQLIVTGKINHDPTITLKPSVPGQLNLFDNETISTHSRKNSGA